MASTRHLCPRRLQRFGPAQQFIKQRLRGTADLFVRSKHPAVVDMALDRRHRDAFHHRHHLQRRDPQLRRLCRPRRRRSSRSHTACNSIRGTRSPLTAAARFRARRRFGTTARRRVVDGRLQIRSTHVLHPTRVPQGAADPHPCKAPGESAQRDLRRPGGERHPSTSGGSRPNGT